MFFLSICMLFKLRKWKFFFIFTVNKIHLYHEKSACLNAFVDENRAKDSTSGSSRLFFAQLFGFTVYVFMVFYSLIHSKHDVISAQIKMYLVLNVNQDL